MKASKILFVLLAFGSYLFAAHKTQESRPDPCKTYTLSICAIIQNEAAWLPEWIEYHRLVGVEHFFLYNHESRDNFQSVLEPYIKEGLVDLHVEQGGRRQESSQVSAYNRCLRDHGHRSQWIAYIDVDEFLVPVFEDDLREILKDYEQFGALTSNWKMFGTSGIERLEDGELLTEKMTWCSGEHHPVNEWVKTIVRTSATKQVGIHVSTYQEGLWAVDSNKQPVTSRLNTRFPFARIQINHYTLRTKEWAYGEKLHRYRQPLWGRKHNVIRYKQTEEAARRRIDSLERQCNSCQDRTIQRFVPRLKERLHKRSCAQRPRILANARKIDV